MQLLVNKIRLFGHTTASSLWSPGWARVPVIDSSLRMRESSTSVSSNNALPKWKVMQLLKRNIKGKGKC